MKRLLLVLAAGACAKAGGSQASGDDQPIDARSTGSDAGDIDAPMIDAPMIDAGPTTVTLTQTTTDNIVPTVSLACKATDGSTREDSWYRVFRLADAGITNGFHVTAVTFAVAAASGLVPVQVKIGTYSGSVSPPPSQLDTALITPLAASTPFQVPNTSGTPTLVTVPVSANVPALSQMIVEVAAPDEQNTAYYFYLGANSDGQSANGYLRSPVCNATQPTVPGSFGAAFTNAHFVIEVTGTY